MKTLAGGLHVQGQGNYNAEKLYVQGQGNYYVSGLHVQG